MALWQYSFFIIPKYSLSNSSSKTISKSEEDELFGDSLFDDSLFWIPEKRSPSFFNRINDIY